MQFLLVRYIYVSNCPRSKVEEKMYLLCFKTFIVKEKLMLLYSQNILADSYTAITHLEVILFKIIALLSSDFNF